MGVSNVNIYYVYCDTNINIYIKLDIFARFVNLKKNICNLCKYQSQFNLVHLNYISLAFRVKK